MRILFLTIYQIRDIREKGIYTDLIRKFRDEGHDMYVVTPDERRNKGITRIERSDNIYILRVKTLNFQKTNVIEKGISTILIEYQFLNSIKTHFADIKFDIVIYSTPPITFTKTIRYIRQRDQAKSYLLLKDIFPQNAVDIGMIGSGGLIHRYFRKKEKRLYANSDYIGCMSDANVSYLLRNNPQVNKEIVEVNPNSIEPAVTVFSSEQKLSVRDKYNIPVESTLFIYGGNLGKPQGISFLIEVLNSHLNKTNVFFLIAGAGTKFPAIKSWFERYQPTNVLLLSELPKKEYDLLLQSGDAGLIFLDKRFTIPNFPSRLLPYLENKLPVLAATDKNTDLGTVIEKNGFGLWSEAGDMGHFNQNLEQFLTNPGLRHDMGEKGYNYLLRNYTVSVSYNTIMSHFQDV